MAVHRIEYTPSYKKKKILEPESPRELILNSIDDIEGSIIFDILESWDDISFGSSKHGQNFKLNRLIWVMILNIQFVESLLRTFHFSLLSVALFANKGSFVSHKCFSNTLICTKLDGFKYFEDNKTCMAHTSYTHTQTRPHT